MNNYIQYNYFLILWNINLWVTDYRYLSSSLELVICSTHITHNVIIDGPSEEQVSFFLNLIESLAREKDTKQICSN